MAEIAALLKKVHSDWCKTVIVVSHDMDEIAESCDRAAVFSDGKIAFCDTPEKLFTQDAEALFSLGLDIPVTAKISRALAAEGIVAPSDLTEKGFVNAVAEQFAADRTASGKTERTETEIGAAEEYGNAASGGRTAGDDKHE